MLRLQHVALSTPSVLPLSSHYQHRISSAICDFPSSGFTVTGFIKCNEYSYAERSCKYLVRAYRYVSSDEEDEESGDGSVRFEEAVKLFNERKYYACHDLLESLWFDSYDPLRTLLHALLQCAVAFYHLFNQNHKGAMMEMGEGLCKLRKLNFKDGPFHEFEQQISSVLNFIYQTQLELAACNEDFCLTMEQTERSYQLLEGFGAGQQLYFLEEESSDGTQQHTYIVFDPQRCYGAINVPITRVQLPFLEATRTHLMACEN